MNTYIKNYGSNIYNECNSSNIYNTYDSSNIYIYNSTYDYDNI